MAGKRAFILLLQLHTAHEKLADLLFQKGAYARSLRERYEENAA